MTTTWTTGTDTTRGAAPGRVHVLEQDESGTLRTVCVARDEETAERIAQMREQLVDRDRRIAELERQLAAAEKRAREWQSAAQAAGAQLAAARKENERLRKDEPWHKAVERAAHLSAENATLRAAADALREERESAQRLATERGQELAALRAEVERLQHMLRESVRLCGEVARELGCPDTWDAGLMAIRALRRQRDDAVGAMRESVRIHDHGCTGCRYDNAQPEVCEGTCVSMNEIRTALAALNNPEGSGDAE